MTAIVRLPSIRLTTLALLVCAGPIAALEGVVRDPAGRPVAGARIEGCAGHPATDAAGHFACEPAGGEVRVSHPFFKTVRVSPEGGVLEIVLEPRASADEEVLVSARRREDRFLPAAGEYRRVTDEQITPERATLTEAVAAQPGVAENGQGGVFQVVSVRGLSRGRVLTHVEGMRIVGERRAGVSPSFVDPALADGIDLVRGPATVTHGAGALGGALDLSLKQPRGFFTELGYETQGNERRVAAGWGDRRFSVAAAARKAEDAEDPDGRPLHTGFTTAVLQLRARGQLRGLEWSALLLPARGDDLAKSNSLYPGRVTDYPYDDHLLARATLGKPGAWGVSAWGHRSELQTKTLRPGRLNQVENEATDHGYAGWLERRFRDGGVTLRGGAESVNRTGVDSREREWTNLAPGAAPRSDLKALDGATEHEHALFALARWKPGPVTLEGGVRHTWHRQGNAGYADRSDRGWTGQLGASVNLPAGLIVNASLSSGLRFASISERFYSGTTPRGGILGNPDLKSERGIQGNLGVNWWGERAHAGLQLHRHRVRRFIEQVAIGGGVTTFINLPGGVIEGLEAEATWRIVDPLTLSLGGHLMRGLADDRAPLADVPADRLDARADWRRGRFSAGLGFSYRHADRHPGPEETARDSVRLYSASAGWKFSKALSLTLAGENLANRRWFNAADAQAPLMPGRSFSVQLGWQPSS